jgi:hypothetical protein
LVNLNLKFANVWDNIQVQEPAIKKKDRFRYCTGDDIMEIKPKTLLLLGLVLFASLFLVSCRSTAAAVPTETTPLPATSTALPSPTATATPEPAPTETITPSATPEPTPIVVGPFDFPEDVNPLTGLQVEDPQILDRRPVMVKVSNFPREGRPHAGLSYADIVFDYFIGEGTNRFLALYYGTDAQKVGPVRSGRLVDGMLVNLYQGILGFSGADQWTVYPYISSILGTRAIVQGPNTCPGLCDEGELHTVTSVFADTAALGKYAEQMHNTSAPNIKQVLEGNAFDARMPETGVPAETLTVQFNIQNLADWRFDPETGKYLRWIESVDLNQNISMVPLTDRLTEEQLAFSNVIVLFAPYTERASTLHEVGLWNNWEGRRAVLFRDGKAIEGVWKTASNDRPPQFFTPEGEPLALKPGNTWIVITGIYSTLQEKIPGQWEMRFFLP